MYSKAQRLVAEALGTGALVLVGPGSVVATLKLGGKVAPFTEADLLGISFAFGLIITALVYALGKVSGCHINPAVTLALAATKRFSWSEVPMYWAAQFVGGILGGLAIWGIFAKSAIDLGMGQASFNPDVTSYAGAAFTEFIGTALLMIAILGIVDRRAPGDLAGLVIGGFVVAIIMVLGPITACAINPARALGPEVVSALGGGPTNWAQFVPAYLIPELVGAVVAAFVYDFLAEPRYARKTAHEAAPAREVAGVELTDASATAAAR
jgi:glycerol uptake facilitator